LGSSNTRFALLKNRAPQIIAAVIIIVIAAYVAFELLADVFIEDAPLTSGPLISTVVSFTHNVKDTVRDLGYFGIFGLMVLESSSLPVPSEVVLPFAGYLISTGQGNLNFVLTVLVATVAAIVGSLVDYYIGLKGIEILTKRRVLGRVFFSIDQLTFAGKWFGKYGSAVVFLARLIPGLRTIISFPAGAAKMPLAKFVAFTTAGCVVWNAVLIYVGIYLGNNWREVASFSEYILIGVIAALAVLTVVYLMVRRRKRKMQLNAQVSQPLKV
jgi:membrane protein DedA with SNARE-associated domain